ncbi:TrlF family AAA-like ATPase [Burkholderia plantarii]|nr:AAA family ATPase [Burkholderia plantarii]
MSNETIGSTWKKWDLHVHTPASIVNNYPGTPEAAWDAFFSDLEALPPEFKVIGVNDYLFVDGYEKVLSAKRNEGRLKNIDLILPVVELRLDKFGGVVKKAANGFMESSWSRINLHVIFDQVDPALIRDQFLSAITPEYHLTADAGAHAAHWGGVITRDNLTALGTAIINSVPDDQKGLFGSPLNEGFNALNVSLEKIKAALAKPLLKERHLIAVGKTEWDALKWNDHTIADKKTVINCADIVFTAAENPQAYANARARLTEAKVNDRLLDCSDAHSLSTAPHKDRIGNCFTWIKADATFAGLQQAIKEFQNRVFVGDVPPKLQLIERNRTKYASTLKVIKRPGSTLKEPWFDVEVPLNSDLVAIIGNKGSGKSALSDIIALVGDTQNREGFSFLNERRFRSPKGKLAQHFVGSLGWRDGTVLDRSLDENPSSSDVERIKYLPQSYLETLCNELGERGSATFDAELRKIIFSHVPEEERLGQASMDELIEFEVAEIDAAREGFVREISKLNTEILAAEERATEEFRAGLVSLLDKRRAELTALDDSKPEPVEDPGASEAAKQESKLAAEQIENFEAQAKAIRDEEGALRERKGAATKRVAVAKRVSQAVANHVKSHDLFVQEIAPLLSELNADLQADRLIELRVNLAPVDAMAGEAAEEIRLVDRILLSEASDGLLKRRQTIEASLSSAKAQLGEKERLFVRYKEALAGWERAKIELVGTKDKMNSIAWIEAEIEGLNALPEYLRQLRTRRIELVKEVHNQIFKAMDEYRRLYEPVREFVKSAEEMEMPLPLDFQVRITESGFQDHFLGKLNRQSKGSFSGVEESNNRMRELLAEASFSTADDAVAFAEKINDMLRYDRRDGDGRPTKLTDQLRRGTEALEILDYIFGLTYLAPRYSLTYDKQEISQLSPGERGLLLLVFYLLVDKDDIPIVIDQPEENLDNQTIYRILVKCIKVAKERRQVIIVTHNPNLAVVCDAEQIIYAERNKVDQHFRYASGAIENPEILSKVVSILEGTEPAFKNRSDKYGI